MAEEFYSNSPHQVLELQGRGDDLLLLFRGQPLQFTYLREVGTTWRYQLARNVSELDVVRDERFRDFVRLGRLGPDALHEQFGYLLNRLAPGRYRLAVEYLDLGINYQPTLPRPDCYASDGYGGLLDLVATQAYLNPDLVTEYEQLIRAGAQPIMVVLTAADSPTTFILDGHHKFQAYTRLGRGGRALVITKLNPRPLHTRRGLELLAQCPDAPAQYRTRYLDYPGR